MDYGDIYHWCDVGCHFNKNGISRLKDYIELVSKDKKGFFLIKNQNIILLTKIINFQVITNINIPRLIY